METIAISETVQKFNGVSYYKCGNYFQRKGIRLHREVWMYHNGEIPTGYHVHHIDGDRANNSIDNLTLMRSDLHLSHHMMGDDRRERSREIANRIRPLAKEWHHSEAGRKWHSKHAKEVMRNIPMQKYTCTFCGKEYEAHYIRYVGNHFCCNNHKAAYRRRLVREGVIPK